MVLVTAVVVLVIHKQQELLVFIEQYNILIQGSPQPY